jgi:hypothetical protein
MKNILSIGFFLLFSMTLFAQNEVTPSQNIQLTDGSVLKGKITKTDDKNNLIYIQLDSGAEISVAANTVVESKKRKGKFHQLPNGKAVKKGGFYIIPQMYTLTARRSKTWEEDSNNIRHAIGLSVTAGHQFKNYLAVGGGIGVDLYEDALMPLFLDIRGNIGKGNLTPYYAVGLGYGFPLGKWLSDGEEWASAKQVEGGKFIYPAIGLKFSTRNAAAFQMDIGYNFQQNERDSSLWWGNESRENIWYKSLAIRMGVAF